MQGTLGPEGAAAAVALHRSHPHAPALDGIDLVMTQLPGSLGDFGDIRPAPDFGQLLTAAFDRGISPEDLRLVERPVGMFVTCSICDITMENAALHMVPYLLVVVAGLLLVAFPPWLSLIVPRLMGMIP